MVIYDFMISLLVFRRMVATHLETTVAVDDGSAEARAWEGPMECPPASERAYRCGPGSRVDGRDSGCRSVASRGSVSTEWIEAPRHELKGVQEKDEVEEERQGQGMARATARKVQGNSLARKEERS